MEAAHLGNAYSISATYDQGESTMAFMIPLGHIQSTCDCSSDSRKWAASAWTAAIAEVVAEAVAGVVAAIRKCLLVDKNRA